MSRPPLHPQIAELVGTLEKMIPTFRRDLDAHAAEREAARARGELEVAGAAMARQCWLEGHVTALEWILGQVEPASAVLKKRAKTPRIFGPQ